MVIVSGVVAGFLPSPIQHLVSYAGPGGPPPTGGPIRYAIVTNANWSAENATVIGTTCTSCSLKVPVASTFPFRVTLRAHCNPFGCASGVGVVTVNPPFTLLFRNTSLGGAFVQNQSVLNLTIQAPRNPGNYSLVGSVTATGIPRTFNVSLVAMAIQYSDAKSGTFLTATQPAPPGLERLGGIFPVYASLKNVGATTVRLDGTTVGIPFELVSSSFLPPAYVLSNATLNVVLQVRAPGTAGAGPVNVTLDSTVELDLSYGTVVTYQVSPYFAIAIAPGPSSLNVLPGATVTEYFDIEGGPNASGYSLAFNYLSGGVVQLVSFSPTGYVSLSSAYQVVVTFDAPVTAGIFTILAHFTEK